MGSSSAGCCCRHGGGWAPCRDSWWPAWSRPVGEVSENSPVVIDRYRAATASLDYYGDSILNSTCDLAAAMIGFWIATKLNWRWVLAFVVAVELVSLYFIRDNLTLNILMLIYPSESIKAWQMGH